MHLASILQRFVGRFGYSIKRRRPGIRRAGATGEIRISTANLMHAIHGCDIYEGFDFHNHPEDLTGWGGDSAAFAQLIGETKPEFIIEVGSWRVPPL